MHTVLDSPIVSVIFFYINCSVGLNSPPLCKVLTILEILKYMGLFLTEMIILKRYKELVYYIFTSIMQSRNS